MRERVKAKIWKRLRRLRGNDALLRSAVERKMKGGASLPEALQAIVLDRGDPPQRAAAVGLLPPPLRRSCLLTLARHLAEDVEGDDFLPIANIFRFLNDPVGVAFFVTALTDANPQRRYAAAYALGLLRPGKRVIDSLIRVVAHARELLSVGGVTAESLNGYTDAVPALVSAVNDNAVDVRFWAVWALGAQSGKQLQQKLEPLLAAKLLDEAIYPGFWSVGLEALAMLATWDLPGT